MFSSRNSSHHRPMVVSYYDESLDQDVLRVIKIIRRRAGLNLSPETKLIKDVPAVPKLKKERRREQQMQSLPKYNVEVQTDSPFNKEKPLIPAVNIVRKFPRKGFRDEFDYVQYDYNNENRLPPKKPTMVTRPNDRECIVQEPLATTTKIIPRPNFSKRPPMVDTFIAAHVKDPDSPTRHIQRIESQNVTSFSDASSSASHPSVFNDVISPISVQPYSFVCSTNIGKKFVTPPKENSLKDASPRIFSSFTEATDNETVDLSINDDVEPPQFASFWDGIVARILGTIAPSAYDDDDVDTVLLTARAKYEDFFEGVASPLSASSLQQRSTAPSGLNGNFVTPITRRQLPQKIRTTLLNDFLDHILGPNESDCADNDDTIAGGSFVEDKYQTKQVADKQAIPRPLLQSLGHPQSRRTVSTTDPLKPHGDPMYRRNRSTLHDIVDQIVARLSSSASDILQRQQPSRSDSASSESDEADEDYDSDDESATNFITEISIPSKFSLNLSTNLKFSDNHGIAATDLSIGRNKKPKHQWKKANIQTMALLDELEDNDDHNDDSSSTDDSSSFSFGSSSFTFD